jgi:CheY-like chemotaxis protein/HPt (histidine-containing phosphotransfer) domain-containing protein
MYSLHPKKAPRVLIADDDPVITHWLTSVLKGEGYDVVSMSDGRKAYRVMQSDADFKGAVFDLSMPFLQGPDLIRYMRTEKRLMRIPVMLITAESDIQVLAHGVAAGPTFLLPKPFTKARLQQTLRMMLRTSNLEETGSLATGKGVSLTGKSLTGASSNTTTTPNPGDAAAVADPPVDFRVLKSLESGEEEEDFSLITELIDLYLEGAERELKAIKAAALEGNQDSMRERCHALRGSSSTIGAVRIAKVCEQLEKPGEQNVFQRVELLVSRLGNEIASARTVLVAKRRETSQLISVY